MIVIKSSSSIITKRYLLVILLLVSLLFQNNAYAKTYKIGDTGPGGGIVFYVLPPDTQSAYHYMEVAPDSWNNSHTLQVSFERANKVSWKYGVDESWFLPGELDVIELYKQRKNLKNVHWLSGYYWTGTRRLGDPRQIVFNMKTGKSKASVVNGFAMYRPISYF